MKAGMKVVMEQGRAEGDRQRALSDAKKKKDLNLEISVIRHVAGLSIEE